VFQDPQHGRGWLEPTRSTRRIPRGSTQGKGDDTELEETPKAGDLYVQTHKGGVTGACTQCHFGRTRGGIREGEGSPPINRPKGAEGKTKGKQQRPVGAGRFSRGFKGLGGFFGLGHPSPNSKKPRPNDSSTRRLFVIVWGWGVY